MHHPTHLFVAASCICFCIARDVQPASTNPRQMEKKILDDILSSKAYDPRIRPPGVNSTGLDISL